MCAPWLFAEPVTPLERRRDDRVLLNLQLPARDGRAALRSWLLRLMPGARSTYRYALPLAHGAIVGLAIILQTFVCKEHDRAHAPFAFATGIVFGLFSPVVAGFAFFLALVTAAGTRSWVMFFPSSPSPFLDSASFSRGKKSPDLRPRRCRPRAALAPHDHVSARLGRDLSRPSPFRRRSRRISDSAPLTRPSRRPASDRPRDCLAPADRAQDRKTTTASHRR